LPYLAKLEKAGIPTVVVDFEDQDQMVRQEALVNGVPEIRIIHASRTLPGPADIDNWMVDMLGALTMPLTDKEKARGKYDPREPRVIFEGTLDEAEEFYQQTKYVPLPVEAPLCRFTDGFPVRIPTEERVAEMLKGTSHKPDELVVLHEDATVMEGLGSPMRKKGEPVLFQPMKRTATVEQVAVNAVMAGCKPEHLPVVLAIAESGCGISTTNFPSQAVCLSGPIVKELRLNTGVGHLGPGSPANGPIGRAYQLMAINLGGATPGVNRMGCHGNPMNNGGMCFAENADGLPPGWDPLNVEAGYERNESIVMVMQANGGIVGSQFSPGGYRALQKSGHGGLARRFDVKGIPGPHNWLNYLVPGLWAGREGGIVMIMIPEMAQHLVDLGFKTKDEVYEWLWKSSFEPVKQYRNRSWPDFFRNGWMGLEKTSGKPWKELPDDYMVPSQGDDPFQNCIIVAGGWEEAAVEILGGRGATFNIDAWR
jgi:hypothetical protein